MGTYVYRITAKKVLCSDGKPANVAIFAYKPYWGFDSDRANAKMHFRSGATSSDNLANKGKLTGRFVLGSEDGTVYQDALVYESPRGSFYDIHLGANIPVIEGLELANKEQHKLNEWATA
jgi:hypothetical protein